MNALYLLRLEPDRMLAYYRERAGLEPKAKPYAGWDGGGRNLTGHIAGHYLSAVSLMWAATGDSRFKERADYIVAQLDEVQDKNGDGYLCALEGGRKAFARLAKGEIRSAAFDLNGEWAPWYTMHKTLAGLRDAYRHTGNRTALKVEIRLAVWIEGILGGLDERQIQRMLNTEFGGINEVLVDLYADTGDRRWLDLSYRFEHHAFLEPLRRHRDNLAGKHGNTQVPKLIGSADRYVVTGNPGDLIAASFFWDRVVQDHSFATGGHGKDEYFGPPGKLNDRIHGRTAETCNVYNMLKLTRCLFAIRPDAHYADFHERALFNHILASMDPEDGRTSYMVPVGQGVQHEYADMMRSFTCCVGSGMESHALHGDGIYYVSGDRLWVNLYTPSRAEWSEAGVRLAVDTDFPEGEHAELTVAVASPKDFVLLLRRPHWTGDGFAVSVNGQPVTAHRRPSAPRREGRRRPLYAVSQEVSSYLELERTWKSGDTVAITIPKSLRLEPLPDNPRRAAILWGPLVLAGDLGPEASRRGRGRARSEPPEVPVFVTAGKPIDSWVERMVGDPVRFRTQRAGREPNAAGRVRDVDLVPFYRLHRRRYCTYWDLFTPGEWEERRAQYADEEERLRRLEAATVAFVTPGDSTSERAFHYRGGRDARPRRILGRLGRRARSWFSYELPVDPAHPMRLLVTFYSDDRRSTPAAFAILVDGKRVAEKELHRTDPPRFFDVAVPIAAELVRGKGKVTVRFQAEEGSQVAAVFGLRMIRADQKR